MKKIKYVLCFLIVFLACEEIIEVEDISNKTVNVLAPADTATLTISTINFSWDTVADAEHYKLQIAEPNFEMANQIVLDTTVTVTNFSQTLEFGDYEWRIRAENSGYQTTYSTQSFTIEE